MPEQGVAVAAAPQTLADETAIYCRQAVNPAGGTHSALFFRPEGQPPGAGIEYDFTTAYKNAAGWLVLPSGMKMVWNTATAPAGTQTLGVVFPDGGFANPSFSVQVTSKGTHAGINTLYYVMSVTDVTALGFNLQRGGTFHDRNIDFSYIAIGF